MSNYYPPRPGNIPTNSGGDLKININGNDDGTSSLFISRPPNTTYNLSFCPYAQSCFAVAQVSSGSQGVINQTFQFTQKGVWAGVFKMENPNDANDTWWSFGYPLQAATEHNTISIVEARTVTGGIAGVGGPVGIEPLTSALLSIATGGGVIQWSLQGAAPNQKYNVIKCDMGISTACATVGSVTTDANGNGHDGSSTTSNAPGIYVFSDSSGAQYVTAIRVK